MEKEGFCFPSNWNDYYYCLQFHIKNCIKISISSQHVGWKHHLVLWFFATHFQCILHILYFFSFLHLLVSFCINYFKTNLYFILNLYLHAIALFWLPVTLTALGFISLTYHTIKGGVEGHSRNCICFSPGVYTIVCT